MIRGEITATGQNLCRFCDRRFYHTDLTVDVCRTCYFNGREHEARLGDLMDTLRALPGVQDAAIDHTGGGCWALVVRRTRDEHYLMGTIAFRNPEGTGDWDTDSDVPETPEGPWCLGQYDEESEAIGDILMPMDRKTLTAYVRGFAAAGEDAR